MIMRVSKRIQEVFSDHRASRQAVMKPAKRLKFEDHLLERITAPRSRQVRRMSSVLWTFLGINVLVWTAAFVLAAGPGSLTLSFGGHSQLSRMTLSFLTALQQGMPEAALETVTVAGTEGAKAVAKENERAYRKNALGSADSPDGAVAEELRAALKDMYADLSRQGVDWARIRPVAFIGVTARAKHPDAMSRAIRLAVGEIYFSFNNDLYAVEITARCPDRTYYVSDIWSWRRIGGLPSDLRSFAASRFEAFENDSTDGGLGVRLSWVRRVFLSF